MSPPFFIIFFVNTMRLGIVHFLFLLITPAFSQIELNESGVYQMQGVESVDSMTQDQLFDKCREWIALTYRSANDVIQLADKENGKIICKGTFARNTAWEEGWVEHTLIIEVKDNRFRYTYTDFAYYGYSAGYSTGRRPFEKSIMGKKKLIAKTVEDINASIVSLKKHFSNSNNDDW